ncbi:MULTISPECIES: hypothetical protein [Streptomyces]|uniref:hypothetical protein n=1 Tax=Streptomyces TaxID=1883 RepID=UPI00225438D9|nr:hypothetical protein [Streptomyces virginiae]MCX5278310.1 hypothetical protein [Streptomyces virginiae]
MNVIVAGQRIVSETEFVEAAMGFDGFTPTADDLQAFAEFVAEGYGPVGQRTEVDAANDLYYRSRKAPRRSRKPRTANADIVPMPHLRSGAGLTEVRKGWAA